MMPKSSPRSLFLDRADAGRQLAARLQALHLDGAAIYALPHGGVPVAVEVAKALKAPLDLVFVREIGAPAPKTARELAEIERRRSVDLGGRPPVSPAGRIAIVVDDGLTTGATAKAALQALRRQGAAKVILAIPVAAQDTLEAMCAEADVVICLETPQPFLGVGSCYDDFHQLTDDETVALLSRTWDEPSGASTLRVHRREVRLPPLGLIGDLQIPPDARGMVLFAHGSGSSRLSPRNRAVADDLNRRGFATLLFDLLAEEEAIDRRKVFDIDLLADRLRHAMAWIDEQPDLAALPIGLFGASTGAGAALKASAGLGKRVGAVVSRGGRPDLAEGDLDRVAAPTLLIVGGADEAVIELNRHAYARLACEKALRLVPGASHLFEEPGTLEQVMALAGDWFQAKLAADRAAPRGGRHDRPGIMDFGGDDA